MYVLSIGGDADYQVTTTYTGYKADNMRQYFLTTSKETIKKEYLNFYSVLYPGIQTSEDPYVIDSSGFKVIENYRIVNLWNKEDTSNIYFELYPLVLNGLLDFPHSAGRSMPYELGPLHYYKQQTFVHLPEHWSIDISDVSIEHDAFSYKGEITSIENIIELNYKYELNKEYLEAEEVADFIAKNQKIEDDLSFSITYSFFDQTSSISALAAFLAFIAVVVGVFLAIRIYSHFDPPGLTNASKLPIGGWLVLPLIGLVATPFVLFSEVFTMDFFSESSWEAMMSSNTTQMKLLLTLVSLELIINILLIVFSILLLILFFKKRTSLPLLIQIFYCVSFLFLLIDSVVASQLDILGYDALSFGSLATDVGKSFITVLIWVPYFTISERVKNTFFIRKIQTLHEDGYSVQTDVDADA